MIRKIKKYIKICILFCFMLNVMMVPFASLTASDGSSFVSKTEFDNAFADFNSRLMTFEAGVNSKIDSQVTSYLDRNGIWSGKGQDLEQKSYIFSQPVTGSAVSKNIRYHMAHQFNETSNPNQYISVYSTKNGVTVYQLVEPMDQWNKLVDNVTKSGMIMIDYTVRLCNYSKKTDTNEQAISKALTNGGMEDGTTSWLYDYNQDVNKIKQLEEYRESNFTYEGLYLYCINNQWTNCAWRQNLVFCKNDTKVEEYRKKLYDNRCSYGNTGQMREPSVIDGTYEWWTCHFTDPIIKDTARFFVTKGEEVDIGSIVDFTGWSKSNSFFSYCKAGILTTVVNIRNCVVW